MSGSFGCVSSPAMMCRSVRQIAQARTPLPASSWWSTSVRPIIANLLVQ